MLTWALQSPPGARPAAHVDPLRAGSGLLLVALAVEIGTAAFEGPLRYGLYALGLDAVIFIRDALLLCGVVWYCLQLAARNRLPMAVPVFCAALCAHAAISFFNLHAPLAIAYGIKLALPLLGGALVAFAIFSPGPWTLRLAAFAWVATVTGAAIDAAVPDDMPWIGVTVDLGGVAVDLGRDWQSVVTKRVGGLTRYSVNLAIVLPLLSMILLAATSRRWLRIAIHATTLLVLYWTTQKGAILGYLMVIVALAATAVPQRTAPLRIMVAAMAALVILAPTLLVHVDPPNSQGVFSLESFAERMKIMWPEGWRWIDQFPPLAGVGLGGIGGAQRFYAPNDYNATDNLFLFLYGNCGILSVLYIVGVTVVLLCADIRDRRDVAAMASAVFLMAYGAVISLVEDQIAALWVGATIGWLARRGTDPAARVRSMFGVRQWLLQAGRAS